MHMASPGLLACRWLRRSAARNSSTGRVLRTSSGSSQARRATATPQRSMPERRRRMRVGIDHELDAAIARQPGVVLVEVEAIDLAVDLERHAGGGGRGEHAIEVEA